VDFLIKKHQSRQAEWVRCNDKSENPRRKTFPLTIVLDNLRSAQNVGSILRTADACGVTEVITTGITPHPNGSGCDKVAKAALGADLIVTTRHFDTTSEAIQTLRVEGHQMIIGMETTKISKLYTDVKYSGEGKGTTLVLGNEVSGVDTRIIPHLDEVVEIPMYGEKNSLNVAAAAPVVMYEILRQWEH